MHIDWGMYKSQGNSRPVMWYEISFSEEEELLNPLLEKPLETDIPVPLAMFVNGGREEEPAEEMLVPSHLDRREDLPRLLIFSDRGKRWVVLPWRGDQYFFEKEVRKAMEDLRRGLEDSLKKSCDSKGFEFSEQIEMSSETRKYLAPFIAKKKMTPF